MWIITLLLLYLPFSITMPWHTSMLRMVCRCATRFIWGGSFVSRVTWGFKLLLSIGQVLSWVKNWCSALTILVPYQYPKRRIRLKITVLFSSEFYMQMPQICISWSFMPISYTILYDNRLDRHTERERGTEKDIKIRK